MKNNDVVITCLGMVVSTALLLVVGVFMNGWALSTIWNWFMPSVFGLVTLSVWQAVGVSMVFSLFTGTNSLKKSSDSSKNKSFGEVLVEGLVTAILVPLLSVGMAWLVFQMAF